jgi:transcriptional regulator with XRE-family HTH domain
MQMSQNEILVSALAERKRRNPNYSLRAFAKNLEISPSHLSLLMNGKKRLTPELANKIASKIDLSPDTRKRFVGATLPNFIETTDHERTLAEDEFRLIADWYHFAIHSLARTKNAIGDHRWVACRLGLDPVIAREALQRLQRLKIVDIRGGKLVSLVKDIATTTDIPSTFIRSHHRQNLALAENKLQTVAVEDRSHSSITVAFDRSKMKTAKKMIEEFKRTLASEVETKNSSEVYTLAIQLFPVSNLGES